MKISGLYFITDSCLSKQGIVADAEQVLEAGCRIVQYREKEKTTAQMVQEAKQLAGMCRKKQALFLVNDRLDIALAADADGVHLGQQDMPVAVVRKLLGKKKIIGATVHSIEEAKLAEKQGADYLSVSPIFRTATKKDAGKPAGLQLVRQVKAVCRLPVVAIGGINESNLQEVLQAGADCVAVISAIVCAESPAVAAKRIIAKIRVMK